MHCILINLDTQPERRQQIEQNFVQTRTANWTLNRISAVGLEQVASSDVKGHLSSPEKGCFLSHLVAIHTSRQLAGHTMIVEDDVLFGTKTFHAIDTALNLASHRDWDILFTDVCVPNVSNMVEMFSLRKDLIARNELQLMPLDNVIFGGSAAYIVNANSKEKLLRLLTENKMLDSPYDLTLRQLVHDKRLKGLVAFPFPTSLSGFADSSQIQQHDASKVADVAWNAFRRLVWLEGSADGAAESLGRIQESVLDPESRVFSKILGCTLSSNFVSK